MITTSPKHTQQKPLDLPHHLSPQKPFPRAQRKQANQTLYSMSQHLEPTQHILRPLHNASLSDISTPLNISDISTPTQPNNAIIGICILKSPRFQINRLRTTPIKQQINDRPSLLFSTHTPKPAPKRAPFSAKHKAHNTNKTGQTDRSPTQNHTKNTTQRPHRQNAPRVAGRKAKGTTISHPTPLSGKKTSDFRRYPQRFLTASCKPIIYL